MLARSELEFTTQRLEEGAPPAPLTPAGYRSLHRHIFQDLYDWAGAYRTANMRHPAHGAFFCKVEFIADQMRQTFERLATIAPDALRAPESFAAALAGPLGDLNAIHPFREGNGRAMRVLIDQVARGNGLFFDQTLVDPAAWNEASRASFMTANPEPLRAVLASALGVAA
jgi:cell filamentation protein